MHIGLIGGIGPTAGAEVVAITSMGGHFCAKAFAALSPLPMIRGPDAVAQHLKQQGIPRRDSRYA